MVDFTRITLAALKDLKISRNYIYQNKPRNRSRNRQIMTVCRRDAAVERTWMWLAGHYLSISAPIPNLNCIICLCAAQN